MVLKSLEGDRIEFCMFPLCLALAEEVFSDNWIVLKSSMIVIDHGLK